MDTYALEQFDADFENANAPATAETHDTHPEADVSTEGPLDQEHRERFRNRFPAYAWDGEFVGQYIALPPIPTVTFYGAYKHFKHWAFPKQWLEPLHWYWSNAVRWPTANDLPPDLWEKIQHGKKLG